MDLSHGFHPDFFLMDVRHQSRHSGDYKKRIPDLWGNIQITQDSSDGTIDIDGEGAACLFGKNFFYDTRDPDVLPCQAQFLCQAEKLDCSWVF
jgi:hypothetical protein